MLIRKAVPSDLETLVQISIDGEVDEDKIQYPRKTKARIIKEKKPSHYKKALLKEMKQKNMHFVVVEEGGEIAGFGQAYLKKYRGGVYFADMVGEIGRVYIKKKFRGRGIGTKLIRYLINHLKKKGVKVVLSYTYTKNRPSLRVHHKLGFREEAYKLVKKI